ncbi:MAG: hypothetical protein K0U98_15750 [Deltaproteobacteria bacterium]|nr:hypothetical protein [Deltaproteobacteria bacterium]
MNKGRLVCFEGIDGSGKTTVAHRVAEALGEKEGQAIFVERRGLDYPEDYQRRRMRLFHEVIWEYGDDPIHELGDLHSLYIMAGWFAVLDRCRIGPLLTRYDHVVIDNWYYKFVARYALKEEMNFQHVTDCFSHLTRPDKVVLLDVSPSVAAARKDSFNLAEAGLLDGFDGDPKESFIRYQTAVRLQLLTMARQEDWLVIETRSDSADQVVERVLERLAADDTPGKLK